ncbi:MAG: MFS transporter [Anaerolineales bacterium]|nr:MFS transporter [Anaerolineales bacterium]
MTTSSPVASQKTNQRNKTLQTILYFAAFITLGITSSAYGPTLPELSANTGVSLKTLAWLFTGSSIGYMLGSLIAGQLYDRIKPHLVITIALFVVAGITALVPTLSIFWLLLAVTVISGFAGGSVDVGGNTLLVWVHREKVGPFMNALHFFFGVGATLSPAIIAFVRNRTDGITWAYWTLALIMLPVAFLASGVKSPTSVAEDHSAAEQKGKLNYLLVFAIMLFFFLYVGSEIGFGAWIFTYATKLELANETAASLMTSAFWGALTLGRLVAIPIAAKVRPRYILLGDTLGCLLSIAVILIWPGSVTALWIGACGLGFAMASMFPTMMTMAESRLTLTGRVTSLFFLGVSLGSMSLPWLMGQLIDSQGPRSLIYIVLTGVSLILGVYALLMALSKNTGAAAGQGKW